MLLRLLLALEPPSICRWWESQVQRIQNPPEGRQPAWEGLWQPLWALWLRIWEELYEAAVFIPISQTRKLSLERAGYLPEVAHDPEPKAEECLPTGSAAQGLSDQDQPFGLGWSFSCFWEMPLWPPLVAPLADNSSQEHTAEAAPQAPPASPARIRLPSLTLGQSWGDSITQ